MRPSWSTYFKDTDAVVLVVDSTDRARVGIVKVRTGSATGWCATFGSGGMVPPSIVHVGIKTELQHLAFRFPNAAK